MKLFNFFKGFSDNKMASECERKVLRFDFMICDATDWEINKETPEIIN